MPNGPRSAQVVSLDEYRRESEVVIHLRALLQDAEAGKVSGVLAVAQYTDSDVAYVGCGSLCENPAAGLYALNTIKNKLLAG